MLTRWVVMPTCLPHVLRRCHTRASGRFRADGKFPVCQRTGPGGEFRVRPGRQVSRPPRAAGAQGRTANVRAR
ncbi:hypothetical protein DEJ47_26960 [Streptomyces venezuelae]|uniref:Uncharacterized protein n=1 Tax=Streptomyces venezuelae TaxID=54571 RepID=A0A5P2BGG1_STRVZ|nr:hypothetical protein DEJ47_26960 [Streptomyces venezuelae]